MNRTAGGKVINVRVTQDEKDRLDKQRRRENFSSLSEWLRKIGLDRVTADEIISRR